jgi:hypothetical protein
MSDTRNLTLRATAIVATVLVISPPPFEIPFALGAQLKDVQPAAASEPVALYITLCLWSGLPPADLSFKLLGISLKIVGRLIAIKHCGVATGPGRLLDESFEGFSFLCHPGPTQRTPRVL